MYRSIRFVDLSTTTCCNIAGTIKKIAFVEIISPDTYLSCNSLVFILNYEVQYKARWSYCIQQQQPYHYHHQHNNNNNNNLFTYIVQISIRKCSDVHYNNIQ